MVQIRHANRSGYGAAAHTPWGSQDTGNEHATNCT